MYVTCSPLLFQRQNRVCFCMPGQQANGSWQIKSETIDLGDRGRLYRCPNFTSPYSRTNDSLIVGPGSLPRLRIGTNGSLSRWARSDPKMNPRESMPTITSAFGWSLRTWSSRRSIQSFSACGSLVNENMSLKINQLFSIVSSSNCDQTRSFRTQCTAESRVNCECTNFGYFESDSIAATIHSTVADVTYAICSRPMYSCIHSTFFICCSVEISLPVHNDLLYLNTKLPRSIVAPNCSHASSLDRY